MKILVFSDSHGYEGKVYTMLERERDADYCFFLGDGIREAQEAQRAYTHISFILVRGNNDLFSQCDDIAYKCIDGVTFVACHGDAFSVRTGLYSLIKKAQSVMAQVALYGHTHIPSAAEGPVTTVNPGALFKGEYCVITTDRGKFTVEHKRI